MRSLAIGGRTACGTQATFWLPFEPRRVRISSQQSRTSIRDALRIVFFTPPRAYGSMKSWSWSILIAAVVVFAPLANAQDESLPKKFKNASPEIRAASGWPAEVRSPQADVSMLAAMAGPDAPHCSTVKVSAPVNFRKRTLIEIPDITEPDLRLANQLMSTGCFARASELLAAVTNASPGNRNATYVLARMSWMLVGIDPAEQVLDRTLAAYPEFVSAKVLLAGIRAEQERVDEVVRLLDEVERKAPTDLWIYMMRLRIEGLRNPSRDLRVRLLEIARNAAFPPNAREEAAEIARHLPNQTPRQYEEVLRVPLDIDSSICMACKAADLAVHLSESERRFSDVIELLESPRAEAGEYLAQAGNRTLLAQAYLIQAAKISAGPSPANKRILDHVDKIVNADYTALAAHVMGRPQAATLQPFLAAFVHPYEEDGYGRTELCNAIMRLNVPAVRSQLEAGADPNGRCLDRSLVGSLVFMGTVEKDEQRREIMRALLQHGAPVTNIDSCRRRDGRGDCFDVLLPLMEQYSRERR
jgi:hypothetical protein